MGILNAKRAELKKVIDELDGLKAKLQKCADDAADLENQAQTCALKLDRYWTTLIIGPRFNYDYVC
jgi:hypothetical protein